MNFDYVLGFGRIMSKKNINKKEINITLIYFNID